MMFEVDVRCRGCEETHTERCDESGIASGVPMQCPHCGRSHPHDPVSDVTTTDDPTLIERATGEVDLDTLRAQQAAYGDEL